MLIKQKVVATNYDEQGNLVRVVEDVEMDMPKSIQLDGICQNPYLLVVQMTVNGLEPMYNTMEEIQYKMFDSQYSVEKYFPAMSRGKYNFRLAPLTTGTDKVIKMSMTSPEPPESGMPINDWIGYLQTALQTSANSSKVDWVKMFPNGNDDTSAISIVLAHSGDNGYGSGNFAIKMPLSIGGKTYSCTVITISDTTGSGQGSVIHSFGHELMHGADVMDLYFQTFWEWIGPFSIMSITDRTYKTKLVGIDPFSAIMNDWCVIETVNSFPTTKSLTERGQYLKVQLTESDVHYIIEKRPNDDYDRYNPNKFLVWRMNTKLMPIAYSRRDYGIAYLDSVERFCHYVVPAGMDNSSLGAVEAGMYGDGTHKLPYLNITINGDSITINKADKDGNIDNSRPLLADPVYDKVLIADMDNYVAGNGKFRVKFRLPKNAGENPVINCYFAKNYLDKEGHLVGDYYEWDTTGFSNTLDSVSFRIDGALEIINTQNYDVDLKLGGGSTTVPVTSVSLNNSTYSFNTLSTVQLSATVLPSNATDKSVTWSTSNSNVATVSNGLVTAKGNGSCTITCTTANGKTATCSITVNVSTSVPVSSVSLSKSTHTFTSNTTLQLSETVLPSNATNKNVNWTTSNSSIATVVNGLVTPKANGTCTVTCTTVDGNYTSTCTITVNITVVEPPVTTQYLVSDVGTLTVNRETSPQGIVVNPTSYTISQGSDTFINATFETDETSYMVEIRKDNNSFVGATKSGDQVTAFTYNLSAGTYQNLTVIAKTYYNGAWVELGKSNPFSITIN